MNRRRFITVSSAGLVGFSLNSVFSANAGVIKKGKIKYLPQHATVLVNETLSKLPHTKLGNGWPAEWQILGITNTVTNLAFDSDRYDDSLGMVVAELSMLKLDVKLTGVPVNCDKVKQLVFVVRNSVDNETEFHMHSTNVELIKTAMWLRVSEEAPNPDQRYYTATFKPFKTAYSPKKTIFEMTFFS